MALPGSPAQALPVIDLGVADEDLVMREVVKASEEWGLFQVVNHGVPAELIQRFQAVGKHFFDLPEAEKQDVARSGEFEGYEKNYLPAIKAWDEHLFNRLWPQSCINYKYWPKNPPEYIEVTEEYTRHMKKLGEKIMGWLSKGLGLRSEAFYESLGGEKTEYVLRINYYRPQLEEPEVKLGAAEHTDIGAFALMVPNEVQGLQAFQDGQWFDLNYVNPAIIVVIGDSAMRLSNGRYKNVFHRVKTNREKTRISWPVFIGPPPDIMMGPFPELTSDENPPKFETKIYKDFVVEKIENWKANDLPLY